VCECRGSGVEEEEEIKERLRVTMDPIYNKQNNIKAAAMIYNT
jgi:hypothetical protein